MAKPHHPGGNVGKGRPKGTPNRATRELKGLAQQFTEEAVEALVGVLRDPNSPAAPRVAAATALLDRGHGKPRQELEHAGKDGRDLIPPETDRAKLAVVLLNILRGDEKPPE